MSTKLTRRQIAVAVASSAAILAQTPANAPIPQTPEEELQAAQASIRRNAEQLAKFDLPMFVEPAVHFKA